VTYSVGRAIDLYYNRKAQMKEMIEFMMKIDHSWETSAQQYISLYQSLK